MPAADALGQLFALLGSEHVGHVGQRPHETLRRLLGQSKLIDPQGLEGRPIDAVPRRQLDRLSPRACMRVRKGSRSAAAAFTIGASCCFCASVASISAYRCLSMRSRR
ncbi:MAG TPA: hypothetical protein VFR64_10490 [Methylomirabilota bacterium]|nr:hypothetical protein [Methylomirabilota bacterium]